MASEYAGFRNANGRVFAPPRRSGPCTIVSSARPTADSSMSVAGVLPILGSESVMVRQPRSSATNRTVALCYIRKSWTRDEKDAISPERQRNNIQAICDAHNWIPEWYQDTEGHRSGMHEKNRPEWLRLKSRLNDSDVVALVANDLARLHRKSWRIGDLLDFVDQHGIKLVIADPERQMDFSTPQGRMFAQLSAIFDEWYAVDVSQRRKADIAHRKSK